MEEYIQNRDIIELKINSKNQETITIELFDVVGRNIHSFSTIVNEGANSIDFPLNNKISAGVYILNIKGETIFDSHKIYLSK